MKVKSPHLREALENVTWAVRETKPNIDGFREEAANLACLTDAEATRDTPPNDRYWLELKQYQGKSSYPPVWLARGLVEATFPEHREVSRDPCVRNMVPAQLACIDLRAAAMQDWITAEACALPRYTRTFGWLVLDATLTFAETQTLPGCDDLLAEMRDIIKRIA